MSLQRIQRHLPASFRQPANANNDSDDTDQDPIDDFFQQNNYERILKCLDDG